MFAEPWFYSMKATVCSILKTLDLEDNYSSTKEHTWPGLDDSIKDTFSAAITGFINIGMAATYNFTVITPGSARLYFDEADTALIDTTAQFPQVETITAPIFLSSGRHLMRLYYANSKGRARFRLRYSSTEAGLPETIVDKVVTFVGGQAPSFLLVDDIATILDGTVKTDRPRLAGSYVTVFSVAPALPTGLRINAFSGVISGSCDESVDADYTITASGPLGLATTTLRITAVGTPLPGLTARFYRVRDAGMSCWLEVVTMDLLTLMVDTVDDAINYPLAQQGSAWSGIPGDVYGEFIVMWSGFVSIDVAGDYEFKVSHRDGVRMSVNHVQIIDHWGCFDELVEKTGAVSFDSTGYAFLDLMFLSSGKDFGVVLSWKKPFATSFEAVPADHLTYIPPSAFSYASPTAQYFRDAAIIPNQPVFFGIPATGYTFIVRPPLPAGLTLQATGEITGTPSAEEEVMTYTVTASQAGAQYTATITFVVASLLPPANVTLHTETGEPVTELSLSQFVTMTPVLFSAANNPRLWSILPALPRGLAFDAQKVGITGTPFAALERTEFTITASNSGGSDTATLILSVAGCQYGKSFYSSVRADNVVSFVLETPLGEEVYRNDAVAPGHYGMALCVPQGDYRFTLRCENVTGTCSLKLTREDDVVFLTQQATAGHPATGEFSTTAKEKPVLTVQSPPVVLPVKGTFFLQYNVTGVYKPLYADPAFPAAVQIDPSYNTISGAFFEKGTYTYDIVAENDVGQTRVKVTFRVGICQDGKDMITFSKPTLFYGESAVVTDEATGEVVMEAAFEGKGYEFITCLRQGEYKVVMKTTVPSGNWVVGGELLVKDVWDDLLASPMLDNGKGEKTEYFSINYAIMDRMPMKFYNQAKKPSNKWNQLKFNDEKWSQGDYSSFGNFAANTAYFRKEFNVDNKNKYSIFAFDLEIYDGVIVYINGQEVIRRNMPAAGVKHETKASARYDALFWRRTAVPTDMLQNGKNVLAVELHRFDNATIAFDMYGSLLSGECMKRTDRGKGSDSEHTPSEKYSPANAFDDNKDTLWRDTNLPVYLQFTYGYDRYEYINMIKLIAGNEVDKNLPKRFDVLGMTSNDGGDVLATVDDRNLFTTSHAAAAVYLKNPKAYNAFRVRVDETNDKGNTASIAEMVLYTCHLLYCPKQKGWDSVRSGVTAYGTCPRNNFGEAVRSCALDKYDPTWSAVDYSNCLSTKPPSKTAYIDFKYMVSNCTLTNFDLYVKGRFGDITRDILMVEKDSLKLFLVRDCSDSETVNVCYYVRVTTTLDQSDVVFSHMNQLQEEMSYRMYTDPPEYFPEGMYFVMVMTPLLRTPPSNIVIIVVTVLVLIIIVSTALMVYGIRTGHVKKLHGGVNRKEKVSLIRQLFTVFSHPQG